MKKRFVIVFKGQKRLSATKQKTIYASTVKAAISKIPSTYDIDEIYSINGWNVGRQESHQSFFAPHVKEKIKRSLR